MSPSLFEFFSNQSKFLCMLPSGFDVNMLRYPSVRALTNYKDQNVHILCPGLSKLRDVGWYFSLFIGILIKHSVSKQRRPRSEAAFCCI